MDEQRVDEAAQRMSRALGPGELDATLRSITAAAVAALPDVHYASISINHSDGRLETVAPTDEMLCEIDAAQYELREGPCYEAAKDTLQVTAPQLASDTRFPRYAAVAVAAGVQAQAGLRLFDTPTASGALNLYSRTAGAFSDPDAVHALFAHQSATVIQYAHELRNLREAAEARKVVGGAVGIAMERYGFTEQRAFAFLTRLAEYHRAELPEVAEAIVAASAERAD